MAGKGLVDVDIGEQEHRGEGITRVLLDLSVGRLGVRVQGVLEGVVVVAEEMSGFVQRRETHPAPAGTHDADRLRSMVAAAGDGAARRGVLNDTDLHAEYFQQRRNVTAGRAGQRLENTRIPPSECCQQELGVLAGPAVVCGDVHRRPQDSRRLAAT